MFWLRNKKIIFLVCTLNLVPGAKYMWKDIILFSLKAILVGLLSPPSGMMH